MFKHDINKFAAGAMGVVVAAALSACTDKWDDHYSGQRPGASESTVYELIKSDPELATFGKMVDIAGCADLLNTSQTFTVWVPDNAALADVDLDDVDEVTRIVKNHLSRFNISTANSSGKGVKMYNGKMLYFEGNTFGGVQLIHSDILAHNGIIHTIASRIPYHYSIREYIDTHSSTTKLAEFLKRFDEQKFDEELSAPIDIDANGATVYDSVLVSYNRLFQDPVYGLGDILSEDSLFTMIIPDNMAWDRAYERIYPLFRNTEADQEKSDSIRDVQTSLAIVENLIFRARISDPSSTGITLTTGGSKITDMGSYFLGTERIDASNGMIFTTSDVNYDPLCTFNKTISVEGEDPQGRQSGRNTNMYVRSISTDHGLAAGVSEGSFLEVTGSGSAQPAVQFEIPGTLSGKYDIYATFVPTVVLDETVTDAYTRMKAMLTFQDPSGRGGKTTLTFQNEDFLTSPTEVVTIRFAEGVELPVSNCYDRLWLMDPANYGATTTVTTTLMLQTDLENKDYVRKRSFNIDRVIFVPSEQ